MGTFSILYFASSQNTIWYTQHLNPYDPVWDCFLTAVCFPTPYLTMKLSLFRSHLNGHLSHTRPFLPNVYPEAVPLAKGVGVC